MNKCSIHNCLLLLVAASIYTIYTYVSHLSPVYASPFASILKCQVMTNNMRMLPQQANNFILTRFHLILMACMHAHTNFA